MSKTTIADAVARLNDRQATQLSDHASDFLERASTELEAKILVRTNLAARQLLHHIALDERSSLQALMVEAMNALFVSRGKPPIA